MKRYFAFLACDEHGITCVADFQTIRACTCCPKATEGLWKLPTYLWRPLNISNSIWNLFKSFFWNSLWRYLRRYLENHQGRSLGFWKSPEDKLIIGCHWRSLEKYSIPFLETHRDSGKIAQASVKVSEGSWNFRRPLKACEGSWKLPRHLEIVGKILKISEAVWKLPRTLKIFEEVLETSEELWKHPKVFKSL